MAFVGQADEPLHSAWLQSANQVLPRLIEAGREPGRAAWTNALFGGYVFEVRFAEANDVVAVVVRAAPAAHVAFTEANDVVAVVVRAAPAAHVAFTEANDVVAAAAHLAYRFAVAFTEANDVVAAGVESYLYAIHVGTIDAEGVIGPDLDEGDVLEDFDVATIDGSSIPVGPLYVDDEDDPIYTTGMFIRLYDSDGVTVLSNLDRASDVNWLDEANGPGTGSFTLPYSEVVTAALCTPGTLVRCYVYGVEAFTWEIGGPPNRSELKAGEEAEESYNFEGNGWAGLLDDIIVEPAIPVLESTPDLTSPFSGRDRVFSFASPDFPNDWWGHAFEHYEFFDIQPFRFQTVEVFEDTFQDIPSPVAMPYPFSDAYQFDVYWIWPGLNFFDQGWGFFRGILINPPAGETLTISVSSDNLFILYVDGVPVMGEMADTFMWTGYKEVSVQLLQSRWYMFGAAVLNTVGAVGPNMNPGGWLCASYYPDGQGVPGSAALVSNGNWTATFSADTWPGWTAGQIMSRLLVEGNQRGAVNGAMGYTFSDFADSNGVPWTVLIEGVYSEFVPTFAVRVGSSVLEAVTQLHEEGWVNFHMRPGTTLLDMWGYDSPPQNSGITFERSTNTFLGNLMDIERQPDQQLANTLLVAYDDGAATKYVRVQDGASIAQYGKHEEVWDSASTSPEDAVRAGKVELRKRAVNSEGGAIVAVYEPRNMAEMPYHGFNVLNTVNFPSLAGGTFPAVVYSIGVSDDGDGNPIFTLELNRRWPDEERTTSRLLRTIGGKTLVTTMKGRL